MRPLGDFDNELILTFGSSPTLTVDEHVRINGPHAQEQRTKRGLIARIWTGWNARALTSSTA
jgi:hypothetical protein